MKLNRLHLYFPTTIFILIFYPARVFAQSFTGTPVNWYMTYIDNYTERLYGLQGEHALMDINGDAKPDLIDLEDDNNTGNVWGNGGQKYWKVYINSGTAFATTASNWNIPYLDNYTERLTGLQGNHALMDINGDAKPDLIDLEDDNNTGNVWGNGGQKYWKVYINSGTAFSTTASNWNIPYLDNYTERLYGLQGNHALQDINGDAKPDLIDLEDDSNTGNVWGNGGQKYWKVYINSGSAFATTASNWNIPYLDNYTERLTGLQGNHALIDLNGDLKPELMDLEDDANTGNVWGNGGQKYWKVYINSGTAFATTASNWNIPYLDNYAERLYGLQGNHTVVDLNGDLKPELMDLEDDANTSNVSGNSGQKYWKVYTNSGSAFANSSINCNIPYLDNYTERIYGLQTEHALVDMNGDFIPELIDLEDDNNTGNVWGNPSQKYWKVYTNTVSGIHAVSNEIVNFTVYPNPFHAMATVRFATMQTNSVITITDAAGRLITQNTFSGTYYTLPADKMSKGVYCVQVFDNKNNSVTKTVVVQ